MELSEDVNIAAEDAAISYKNNIIEKKAETVGLLLDVANTVEIIRKQLMTDPWNTVKLNRSADFEFRKVEPDVMLNDYNDIQQIFAVYSTEILSKELSDSIKYAAHAINGVVIPGASTSSGEAQVFSFLECLKAGNISFENDNEGYDQVASTLYAALLSSGIPYNSITRLSHELAVDYIEPGLDAWICGNGGDLRFTNPFNGKIAVFARVDGDRVTVAVAGSLSDNPGKQDLKTEAVQKFSPPVYYVENKSLKKGEKVTISPGKEGVLVEVYCNGVVIGTDKYEAEKKIIQIGPGTYLRNEDK